MKKLLAVVLFVAFSIQMGFASDDIQNYAKSRSNDLRLGVYITAHSVRDHLSTDMGRREALSLVQSLGMSKVFVEFYRGGLVIDSQLLKDVNQFFTDNDIDVIGGVATVPGENFGVHQEGPLGWFNWQNEKTQTDLLGVMQMAAHVFDKIIIDDFVCSSDTSKESKAAKKDLSWSEYRRNLLVDIASNIFLKEVHKINPDCEVTIKFPQWYDRFHLFGYDIPRQSAQFDNVWVGTETRGARTQRYGFVQPYEGYVNYRWINSIAGKVSGAWFDHGDCQPLDFIDQAYQSVLAGANEITMFHYGDFLWGHGGHHYLRSEFDKLADLAAKVTGDEETVIYGYKPANSDAGGDLYIMDFIGMLGIPLVPASEWPEQAEILFIPTQAAKDKDIESRVFQAVKKQKTVIMTTGFLSVMNSKKLNQLAGFEHPVKSNPVRAEFITFNDVPQIVQEGLLLESDAATKDAKAIITANYKNETIPFFTQNQNNIFVLNSHTFSQADFDAVGEVLLCPRDLGLLYLPPNAISSLRNSIIGKLGMEMQAPTRVTLQPVGKSGWFLQNYNEEPVIIKLKIENKSDSFKNVFTGENIAINKDGFATIIIPKRSRIWVQ